MENTRQILKIRINKSTDEVNQILNNYLKTSKFVEVDYNGEIVYKHNSFMSKLDFFKTYLKFYLSDSELTIIGWVTYKNTEYGFDDVLDLNDPYKNSNWKVTQNLYSMFYAFASGLKAEGENVICNKVSSGETMLPVDNNKFIFNK